MRVPTVAARRTDRQPLRGGAPLCAASRFVSGGWGLVQLCRERPLAREWLSVAVALAGVGGAAGSRICTSGSTVVASLVSAGDRAVAGRAGAVGGVRVAGSGAAGAWLHDAA